MVPVELKKLICIILHYNMYYFHFTLASAKTQVSLTRFLQSEVKIIHIIVQDQDGQNNNIKKLLLKPQVSDKVLVS